LWSIFHVLAGNGAKVLPICGATAQRARANWSPTSDGVLCESDAGIPIRHRRGKSHITLSQILADTDETCCADARHKIFALLDLLSDHERLLLADLPDYSMTRSQLLQRVLRHVLCSESSDGILQDPRMIKQASTSILQALGASAWPTWSRSQEDSTVLGVVFVFNALISRFLWSVPEHSIRLRPVEDETARSSKELLDHLRQHHVFANDSFTHADAYEAITASLQHEDCSRDALRTPPSSMPTHMDSDEAQASRAINDWHSEKYIRDGEPDLDIVKKVTLRPQWRGMRAIQFN
jgi:hypothetical protein